MKSLRKVAHDGTQPVPSESKKLETQSWISTKSENVLPFRKKVPKDDRGAISNTNPATARAGLSGDGRLLKIRNIARATRKGAEQGRVSGFLLLPHGEGMALALPQHDSTGR